MFVKSQTWKISKPNAHIDAFEQVDISSLAGAEMMKTYESAVRPHCANVRAFPHL
jgi:hypothetical protein